MSKTIRYGNAPLATMALTAVLLAGVAGCHQAPDDSTLNSQVQQKLSADTGLVNQTIQPVTVNGIVTLNGTVDNPAARNLAASDAASVANVKQVVNNLTIAAPAIAETAPVPVAPMPAAKPAPVRPAAKPAPAKPAPAPAPVVRTAPPPPPPAQPAPAPQPVIRTVTVPSGTTLPIRITQTLDSGTTQQGDSFSGVVASDIVQDGVVAIPRGAAVSGRVSEVHEAAHFKGSSLLSIELTGLTVRGRNIPLSTQAYSVEGKGRGKNTAVKTGIGAAAGAVLGGIFGGGKGAAIGAAAGGGTGAGINAITRGEQVQIPSESVVPFTVTNTIAVRISAN